MLLREFKVVEFKKGVLATKKQYRIRTEWLNGPTQVRFLLGPLQQLFHLPKEWKHMWLRVYSTPGVNRVRLYGNSRISVEMCGDFAWIYTLSEYERLDRPRREAEAARQVVYDGVSDAVLSELAKKLEKKQLYLEVAYTE
jgi:hypothetical protein